MIRSSGKCTVKLLTDRGVRGSLGSVGRSVGRSGWGGCGAVSGGCRGRSGDLVPGGESCTVKLLGRGGMGLSVDLRGGIRLGTVLSLYKGHRYPEKIISHCVAISRVRTKWGRQATSAVDLWVGAGGLGPQLSTASPTNPAHENRRNESWTKTSAPNRS